MNKYFRRISLLFAMVMMAAMFVGLCPGLNLYAYAEGGIVDEGDPGDLEAAALVTLSDVEVVLDEGETNVPLLGSSVNSYYRNLNFSIPDGTPITMVAMYEWWGKSWDESSYSYIHYNNTAPTYFDRDHTYKCVLQVALTMSKGYTEYTFADDATLRIGNLTYKIDPSRTSYPEDQNKMLAYFVCDDVGKSNITVSEIQVTYENKDDVLGDLDAGSTVSYEPTKHVLTLNNAYLSNDYQDWLVYDCIFDDMPELNIELIGLNQINYITRVDETEYDMWPAMTSIIYHPGKNLNIYGSGSLEIHLEPYYNGPDEYYQDANAISAKNLNITDARVEVSCKNAEDEIITAYENLTLSGSAKLSINPSYDYDDTSYWFKAINAYQKVIMKDDSEIDAYAPYASSVGIDAGEGVFMSDRSMLSISAEEVFGAEKVTDFDENGYEYFTGEYEFTDLFFDNHEYANAIVRVKGAEHSDRNLWDGSANIGEGFYTYVQIPAPIHVDAVAPTFTEAGLMEHYRDPFSTKLYTDPAGKNVINQEDLVIPPLGQKANTLRVSGKTVGIKYSSLKKKTQYLAVSKIIKFASKGQGTRAYTLYSATRSGKSYKKYFKVNKSTGKLAVKKGLKKGTYKVKVKVKATGNEEYKASVWKTVTITIKVK